MNPFWSCLESYNQGIRMRVCRYGPTSEVNSLTSLTVFRAYQLSDNICWGRFQRSITAHVIVIFPDELSHCRNTLPNLPLHGNARDYISGCGGVFVMPEAIYLPQNKRERHSWRKYSYLWFEYHQGPVILLEMIDIPNRSPWRDATAYQIQLFLLLSAWSYASSTVCILQTW